MDSTITIREYELEDVKEMVELGELMHKEGAYSFLPYSKAKLRELGKRFKQTDYGNAWVAIADGKVIGMYVAFITEYFFCYEKIAQDFLLYIHPDHRKGTIAIRLVKKAEEWARERGAKEFCPASSMAISSGRLEKLYNFMKFKTVGHIFKKRLD
jgi:GNAT superfamily N-acetyltransferase|tara:strand:- start:36 stop:500 length:465 start_codon:yes stop_codon:yes gene_type:complete